MAPEMTPKKPTPRCPRCKSKRMSRRLDGSRFCARCGQRVANDGRLIPSADRRSIETEPEPQMNLL